MLDKDEIIVYSASNHCFVDSLRESWNSCRVICVCIDVKQVMVTAFCNTYHMTEVRKIMQEHVSYMDEDISSLYDVAHRFIPNVRTKI